MKRPRVSWMVALLCVLAGCERGAVLRPAGPQAAEIERLWWVYLAVVTVVFVLVLTAALLGVLKRKPASDATLTRVVWVSVIATVLILCGLVVASFLTGRKLATFGRQPVLTIEII